jgi:hypothetical protein
MRQGILSLKFLCRTRVSLRCRIPTVVALAVWSQQRLPPLLQGRAACVHTISGQLVLSRAELLSRPTVPAPTALAAAPPQCAEPGARRQALCRAPPAGTVRVHRLGRCIATLARA